MSDKEFKELDVFVETLKTENVLKGVKPERKYRIIGDIENGFRDGKPIVSKDDVTRCVKRITDTHVICECGRRFLINENLRIEGIETIPPSAAIY
jgi:hypothetical protein